MRSWIVPESPSKLASCCQFAANRVDTMDTIDTFADNSESVGRWDLPPRSFVHSPKSRILSGITSRRVQRNLKSQGRLIRSA
jgi:hypothetical protein